MLPTALVQVRRTCVKTEESVWSYFGGCDYFRLASDPRIKRAVSTAAMRHGIGVSASRKTTGNHPLYEDLEGRLETFFGTPAVLTSNGYVTNSVVVQALSKDITHCLLDERAHPSLCDAARMANCPRETFAHQNPRALARILERLPRSAKPLVLTDGMFAYDGSIPPLDQYFSRLPSTAQLLIDDAHAAGIIAGGRGTVALFSLPRERVVQTVTFSKAFGTFGGAILCSEKVRNLILQDSQHFTGSTPPPLPLVAGTIASLAIISKQGGMQKRLAQNVNRFRNALGLAGCDPERINPILAIYAISRKQTEHLRVALEREGVYPSLIRYPGAAKADFFRFSISSEHSQRQLDQLIRAIRPLSEKPIISTENS